MSNFGASAIFGSAVFGGDPTPYLLYTVDAETTTMARRLMARGQTDGTSFQAVSINIGSGGFDPLDYLAAIPVNPDAQTLDSLEWDATISHYEWCNERSVAYYCEVPSSKANTTLGEVGVVGQIQWSPYGAEIGVQFLMAIGHFPMKAKTDYETLVFRVTMQA